MFHDAPTSPSLSKERQRSPYNVDLTVRTLLLTIPLPLSSYPANMTPFTTPFTTPSSANATTNATNARSPFSTWSASNPEQLIHVRFRCDYDGAPVGTITVPFPKNVMLGETSLIAGCFRELKKANFTPPRLTGVRLYENGRLYRDRKLTPSDDNRLVLDIKPGKNIEHRASGLVPAHPYSIRRLKHTSFLEIMNFTFMALLFLASAATFTAWVQDYGNRGTYNGYVWVGIGTAVVNLMSAHLVTEAKRLITDCFINQA